MLCLPRIKNHLGGIGDIVFSPIPEDFGELFELISFPINPENSDLIESTETNHEEEELEKIQIKVKYKQNVIYIPVYDFNPVGFDIVSGSDGSGWLCMIGTKDDKQLIKLESLSTKGQLLAGR